MIKSSGPKLVRQPCLMDPLLITGLSRSGKTMLAPIVSSLERVEPVGFNYLLEEVPMMHALGLMNEETAVFMMRSAVDFMAYDISLGRNANFRPGDISSIWKYKQPQQFFQRLFLPEGESVWQKIHETQPLLSLLVHNALWHADIYFKSFPHLKMIHIHRHPLDIAYSWYKRGYGRSQLDSPRNALVTIQWHQNSFPFYVAGFEESYEKMSEADRVVFLVEKVWQNHETSFQALTSSQLRGIHIVYFEEMVTNPGPILEKLCEFLGSRKTVYTAVVCQQERCPRKISDEEKEMKKKEFKKALSAEGYSRLSEMSERYEEILSGYLTEFKGNHG